MPLAQFMLSIVNRTELGDGTLGWLVFGCLITFLLSRKKGRTLLVSLAWAGLSGGVGFFLGSVATTAIERLTAAKIAKGAGEFFISSSGTAWIPAALKWVTKKAEGLNE